MSGQDLRNSFETVGVMVASPKCSEDTAREVVRRLRVADASEHVLVAARLFHEVLTLDPETHNYYLFALYKGMPTLLKSAVLHALDDPQLSVFEELTDSEAMLAFNVARWLLGLSQKSFEPITEEFVSRHVHPPVRFHQPGVRVPRQRIHPPAASEVMNLTRLNDPAVA